MTAGTMPMARPKSKPKTKAETGQAESRMTNRALRMNQSYANWIERAAKFDRTTISGLIDRAVARYMKEIGFPEEPPERL